MKILIADDELVSRTLLESYLQFWGYVPVSVSHGKEALEILKGPDAPLIAILDWMMPYMSGPEVCQAVQKLQKPVSPYMLLVTSKADKRDIVRGLQAGAQDYVTKPYDPNELQARVDVGRRMVHLQQLLAQRITELEEATRQIRQLRGLLPICCRCKKVRSDDGYWSEVDTYITSHTDTKFSHSFCPDCYKVAIAEFSQNSPDIAA
jgi:DNA-binding response OmpR family regulator